VVTATDQETGSTRTACTPMYESSNTTTSCWLRLPSRDFEDLEGGEKRLRVRLAVRNVAGGDDSREIGSSTCSAVRMYSISRRAAPEATTSGRSPGNERE
jgi:hypothetical protein